MRSPQRVRLVAGAVAVAVGFGLIGLGSPASAGAGYDKTSAVEKNRVDSVPTPKLDWWSCYSGFSCASVKLPRDYDNPKGAKVEIGIVKYSARKPKSRIGTLFVNPGGPGESATDLALLAPGAFSQSVLDRFDVVGFDPRGVNTSDTVRCFPGAKEQAPVLETIASTPFPYGAKAEQAFVKAYRAEGRACATTGQPLSTSMSTAEVARDMDVLRRAVGDKKLSYLGFSYGTYLGQVYANLFPDRVRALALDGVLDPVGWAGTKATQDTPLEDRIGSAEGASKALHELLVRCDKAGGLYCRFAPGNPVANFDLIANRLKKRPVLMEDPFTGEPIPYGYPDLVGDILTGLYYSDGANDIDSILSNLIIVTEPPATRDDAAARAQAARRQAARKALGAAVHTLTSRADVGRPTPRHAFPYDSSLDAFGSVTCTDSLNPADIAAYPGYAARADKRSPYFGRLWMWQEAMCARNTFTSKDKDAYRGSFTKKTIKPLLFVGDYYDPATSYNSAVKAAKLAPNSRLLRSNSWGHTAYGTSECVTNGVDNYLLKLTLPSTKVCVGDDQPFTGDSGDDEGGRALALQKLLARSRR